MYINNVQVDQAVEHPRVSIKIGVQKCPEIKIRQHRRRQRQSKPDRRSGKSLARKGKIFLHREAQNVLRREFLSFVIFFIFFLVRCRAPALEVANKERLGSSSVLGFPSLSDPKLFVTLLQLHPGADP
jgi:hypothetical protein